MDFQIWLKYKYDKNLYTYHIVDILYDMTLHKLNNLGLKLKDEEYFFQQFVYFIYCHSNTDYRLIRVKLDEVREVQLELEKEQRRLEDEILTMVAKRDSMIEAYQRQKILLVDDNKKLEKENEIQLIAQRIEQFQMEKFGPNNGEIYKISNQLFAPVLAKIDAAIQKIGKEQGYDLILDAQSGALVFGEDEHNLTHAVLEELRKNALENQTE